MQFYRNQLAWKEISELLPDSNRINDNMAPKEYFMDWRNYKIHIDHYENTFAPAKIIILHGVGGNGRLLQFIGVPLARSGYEVISPDLPGYGLSVVDKKKVTYMDWVEFVRDLIEIEKTKDSRPIFVFGLSAGGMLAYHATCLNNKVSGIIATNLLDQRNQKVRDYSAGNIIMSRLGIWGLKMLAQINGSILLPMKAVANMKAIVNNKMLLKILLNDETSSGAKIPVNFIKTMIDYFPAVEPENFKIPVLLVHPEKDSWTPVHVSRIFFDRLGADKKLEILENAGHFPIENPGINQLEKFVVQFIEEYK